jgi:threonine synthase
MTATPAGVIARYDDLLPVTSDTPVLTLYEGSTPLVPVRRLADWVGVDTLYLKCEGANPTGSFKDRGMVVAVAKAIEEGAATVLCASTGNTAASAAAYAARAGVGAIVLLPRGKVALGKLSQAMICGARAVAIDGGFDAALDAARVLAERYRVALVNSVNPYRIDGQATAAYEICDVLGGPPDVLALPVGNGGNITAYWLGFQRYRAIGEIELCPRLIGVQAAGAAPLVLGTPVAEPETVATAIRIGRPASWGPALAAARESGGAILAVADGEILEAYAAAARLEGIFCEPASAASLAGLRSGVRRGVVDRGVRAVCVLTGHGLKDPERALAEAEGSLLDVSADVEEIARVLALARAA